MASGVLEKPRGEINYYYKIIIIEFGKGGRLGAASIAVNTAELHLPAVHRISLLLINLASCTIFSGTLSREEPPVATTRALGPKNGEPPAVAVHETRPSLLSSLYSGHKLITLRLGVPRFISARCKHAMRQALGLKQSVLHGRY